MNLSQIIEAVSPPGRRLMPTDTRCRTTRIKTRILVGKQAKLLQIAIGFLPDGSLKESVVADLSSPAPSKLVPLAKIAKRRWELLESSYVVIDHTNVQKVRAGVRGYHPENLLGVIANVLGIQHRLPT